MYKQLTSPNNGIKDKFSLKDQNVRPTNDNKENPHRDFVFE
jgi:hypothetical protein